MNGHNMSLTVYAFWINGTQSIFCCPFKMKIYHDYSKLDDGYTKTK